MDFLNNLNTIIQNNPMLTAVIGLSGAGIATFWLKDVPKSIYNFLKRELTTELIITSQNKVFHELLKWIDKKYRNKNFRKIKLTNGRWGYNDETTTSIGYGFHWIRYKNKFFLINLNKESSNQSEYDKETMTILIIGRSRKIFDELVKEVSTIDLDLTKTKVYKMEDSWSYIKDQQKRSLNSIFIEKYKKDLLIDTLSKFIENEQWYIDNGIPYQLGILLYGAPGTGKTSLIKAIAGYLNYPIYYLSPKKLGKIETAMSTLSDKCIVVVEDIDSNYLTHTREVINNSTSVDDKLMEEFSTISLSEVLNSLDGMFSVHGRILIATTNHIESLDAALIRPGRIDLKIEVGYVNNEILKDFLNKFYPNNKTKTINLELKPNLTIAALQNLVLNGNDIEDIINYCEN
jgi:chaperone BCS1